MEIVLPWIIASAAGWCGLVLALCWCFFLRCDLWAARGEAKLYKDRWLREYDDLHAYEPGPEDVILANRPPASYQWKGDDS